MLIKQSAFIVVIVAMNLLAPSCGNQLDKNIAIDRTSPNGTYRARIEVREIPPKGSRDHTEVTEVKVLKGNEIVLTSKWEDSDQYEPTFSETKPRIEWINDAVLRMGEDTSDQPFSDEIVISNDSDEPLKYLNVGYGKSELFWVFDLPPKASITLRASPRFKPDGTSNFFVGYGGMSQNGKKFEGTKTGRERKSPTEGPLKFELKIGRTDLAKN